MVMVVTPGGNSDVYKRQADRQPDRPFAGPKLSRTRIRKGRDNFMAWIKISTKTTDENGKVVFDNLPYGNYKIQQTSAKMGYTHDSAETSVAVSYTNLDVYKRQVL